jgi:hypothetical protein
MDQFEYLPIFLVMLSLYMLIRNRITWSAVIAGIGAMAKLFPAVVFLLALFGLERKHKVKYVVVFTLTCFIIVSPYLIGGTQPLRSWVEFSTARGGWETVWTYPQIKFPPIPNPRQLTVPYTSDASPYGWLAWLAAASMLGYLWWQRRSSSNALYVRKALCMILLLLIFSKGVSSYFIFWIFPLLFICYRPLAAFAICMTLMLVANIEFFIDTYWTSIWTRHSIFAALFAHQAIRSRTDDIGVLPDAAP